eukprot:CAMPEP_0115167462 /NCGR_PEP_ID=MMETSP0270-20121206/230_1 /TAXON_ID=71861 /ORGANISM="Scrippsiella trochoidea, Strain CCMP3099" /LENGTH=96 /DNA_ID=CAMNT_0002580059 /DNA_START=219 /DNA_END=505 /DNA_ORIENTATION=-
MGGCADPRRLESRVWPGIKQGFSGTQHHSLVPGFRCKFRRVRTRPCNAQLSFSSGSGDLEGGLVATTAAAAPSPTTTAVPSPVATIAPPPAPMETA